MPVSRLPLLLHVTISSPPEKKLARFLMPRPGCAGICSLPSSKKQFKQRRKQCLRQRTSIKRLIFNPGISREFRFSQFVYNVRNSPNKICKGRFTRYDFVAYKICKGRFTRYDFVAYKICKGRFTRVYTVRLCRMRQVYDRPTT